MARNSASTKKYLKGNLHLVSSLKIKFPIIPSIKSETGLITHLFIGSSKSIGPTPKLADLYDPSSKKNLIKNRFPSNFILNRQFNSFIKLLKKYEIQIYQPDNIMKCNQLFARDLGFVIDNTWVRSNIIPNRLLEMDGLDSLQQMIPVENQLILSDEFHIEGGDVIIYDDYVFIGVYTRSDYSKLTTARTNMDSIHELQKNFPKKKFVPIELNKSNNIPKDNALHLDCCMQPVGNNFLVTCSESFTYTYQYEWLVNLFGKNNVFDVSKKEMSRMMCNVFSISETVVVSDKSFKRLNEWMENKNIKVEKINFREVSKLGGLFRCVTMPLIRK